MSEEGTRPIRLALAVTTFSSDDFVFGALKAGAAGSSSNAPRPLSWWRPFGRWPRVRACCIPMPYASWRCGVETVRSQVAAVLRKLEARDRTHAVLLAYGLVDLDPA